LRATELAFAGLLKDAPGGVDVRLTLFTLPQIPRSAETRARMEGFYADVDAAAAAGMDALIVASEDEDVPAVWDGLRSLVDGAEKTGLSLLFSGGAALAAVRHLSGITAHDLPRERTGIFTAARDGEHALLSNMPAQWPVPHAALKALPPASLAAQNYRILSRLTDGAVDSFLRQQRGLFLFLAGHPEYEPRALARRFLAGMAGFAQGGPMPPMPVHYFDRLTENRIAELTGRQVRDFSAYQKLVQGAVPFAGWRPHALKQCAAWLAAIAQEKQAKTASAARAGRRRRA